jgi:hypothetical protein
MGSMALSDVEAETFSVRYRLTLADARAIAWLQPHQEGGQTGIARWAAAARVRLD